MEKKYKKMADAITRLMTCWLSMGEAFEDFPVEADYVFGKAHLNEDEFEDATWEDKMNAAYQEIFRKEENYEDFLVEQLKFLVEIKERFKDSLCSDPASTYDDSSIGKAIDCLICGLKSNVLKEIVKELDNFLQAFDYEFAITTYRIGQEYWGFLSDKFFRSNTFATVGRLDDITIDDRQYQFCCYASLSQATETSNGIVAMMYRKNGRIYADLYDYKERYVQSGLQRDYRLQYDALPMDIDNITVSAQRLAVAINSI